MMNPELAEKITRFQTALHARLEALSAFHKNMIIIGVGLATCMEIGTTTAVNVILPDMQGNVAASADQISWAITIYSTAFLCSLPLSPWLAMRFGHRNHLLLSIGLYVLGALGCFLSDELGILLISRAVMGLGGGALLVRSLVTIYQLFQGKARAKIFLTFGTIVVGSKMLMPLLFGVLADWIKWNAAFLIIVPIAFSSAALIYLFMPGGIHFEAAPVRPDFAGIGFLVAGVTAFQFIASRGEQDNWFGSFHLRVAFVIGLFALAAFVWRDSDLNNANPILSLRLIATQPALFASLGIAVVFGAVLGGGLYVLPQYLRTIQNYSATQTGEFFFVNGLASWVGFYLMIKLSGPVSLINLLLSAFILFIAGNFIFVNILTGDTPSAVICMAVSVNGIATGMLLPGISLLILPQIDLRVVTFGAAIYLFFRQLGTSIGVSAVLALIDIRQTLHSSRLLDTANRLDPKTTEVTRLLAGLLHNRGLPVTNSFLGADQLFSGLVSTQARLLAFIDVFWALQLLGLAGLVLLLIRKVMPNATSSAPASPVEHAPAAIHA